MNDFYLEQLDKLNKEIKGYEKYIEIRQVDVIYTPIDEIKLKDTPLIKIYSEKNEFEYKNLIVDLQAFITGKLQYYGKLHKYERKRKSMEHVEEEL